MNYLRLCLSWLARPTQTLWTVKQHSAKIRYALASVLIHSLVAGSKQLYLHFTNAPVDFAPFLRYPAEQT